MMETQTRTWLDSASRLRSSGRCQEVNGEWGNHKGFLKAIKQFKSKSASKLLNVGIIKLIKPGPYFLGRRYKALWLFELGSALPESSSKLGGSPSLCLGLGWFLISCLCFLILEGLPLCLPALWGFLSPQHCLFANHILELCSGRHSCVSQL